MCTTITAIRIGATEMHEYAYEWHRIGRVGIKFRSRKCPPARPGIDGVHQPIGKRFEMVLCHWSDYRPAKHKSGNQPFYTPLEASARNLPVASLVDRFRRADRLRGMEAMNDCSAYSKCVLSEKEGLKLHVKSAYRPVVKVQ